VRVCIKNKKGDLKMVTIICSYCEYVGQDKSKSKYRNYDKEIEDVEKHEETCPENDEKED